MVGINPTTFNLVMNVSFDTFKRGDILSSGTEHEVIVHDFNGYKHPNSILRVQTCDDLEVEYRHFQFLTKYNLLT